MTEALLLMGGMGLIISAVLALASKVFYVYVDPKILDVEDALPGANCGGCGFAGCADYAKAGVVNGAQINLCAPGAAEVLERLSEMMGVEASAAEKKVAMGLCGGDNSKADRKFGYNGIADCAAAAAVGGGEKACGYGCLGTGIHNREI